VNRQALEAEHAAIVEGGGTVALDDWSTIRVTGADRASFLHNMCTNDVKGLRTGESCEAFFTDVKGKIVAHAFLFAEAEALELLLEPGQAERLISHLDRYIIREDVQLTDVSAQVCWTLALGPLMKQVTFDEARGNLAFRCDAAWCGGCFTRSNRDEAARLREFSRDAGNLECSPEVWQAVRVESAWPLFGVDFDSSNLPQEVNRDVQAIHFRKGCYLGQETIARIDALGHVNKKLVQVRFEGDEAPEAGSEGFHGAEAVGRVTSSCWSPRCKAPLALAMVQRGANDVGSEVRSHDRAGEVISTAAPT
jgi:folate-binding protein YgfZ